MKYTIDELVNRDASLISRRCWTDPAVYKPEKRGIFGRAWLFPGHESQIRRPGDFVQAYMCETPIIPSRGETASSTPISTVAATGPARLPGDHGNTKRFICPYHNWSYTVEGALATIPQESALRNKPDKRPLGLKPVPRIASWRAWCSAVSIRILCRSRITWVICALSRRLPRPVSQGIEFMGAPTAGCSTRIGNCQWKPAGDVNHGAFLH